MFVSPTLKKYAKEKEMKISKDFVYGEIDGYMVTIVEGVDIKILSVSCKIDENKNVVKFLENAKSKKDFYISDYKISNEGIQLIFKEVRYCMPVIVTPKVKKFLGEFIPVLKENGAIGLEKCAECSEYIDNEAQAKLVMKNGFVHKVHSDCVQKLLESDEKAEVAPQQKNGVARGTVGALLGTAFGAFWLWLIMFWGSNFSYILIILSCVLVALLTGLFSTKCYNWFGGKVCKSGLVAVCICQLIGYLISYPVMIGSSFTVLTIKHLIKDGAELEFQVVLENVIAVLKVFFLDDELHSSGFFWFFVLSVVALSLLTGPYGFLRKYVNQNLKSMKISKELE